MLTTTTSAAAPAASRDKVWLLRIAAIAATVGLLALTAPFIWLAVSAGVGLLALGAIALAGFVALSALPLALQKWENRMLSARKREAHTNPIEQLQNDCLRRAQKLTEFRAALASIGGQIETMRQMLQERRHKAPQYELNRQEAAVNRMEHFYRANIGRLEEAHHALEAFRDQVKHKAFEWEFAQAGKVVMTTLNPSEVNDLMQNLLSDEALRSVQDRFNTVFAELDVDLHSIHAPTREFMAIDPDPLDALTVRQALRTRSLQ